MMSGQFSLGGAAARFVIVALGGIAFGFVIGLIIRELHRHLDDPPVQITLSLLTPFLAYLPAERLHVSGVLAVVTAGIFLGWHSPLIVTARYRLQSTAFWQMLVFLLNGFVFISIGLQLPAILQELRGESLVVLLKDAAWLSLAIVVVRIAWVFPATCLPRLLLPGLRQRDPFPGWRNVAIVAWSGMRGVISLAAAFALPFTLPNGNPFPARNYILFFTFCVILVTLVLQGLTLPLLIRALRVRDSSEADEEECTARTQANRAALELIDRLARECGVPEEPVDRLRAEYNERLAELAGCAANGDASGEIATPHYRRLQLEALKVERHTIIQLRNQHVINDDALRRIQRDLDLAETRLAG
jgi:CPA1 family monovalent cation:H+ antiporter